MLKQKINREIFRNIIAARNANEMQCEVLTWWIWLCPYEKYTSVTGNPSSAWFSCSVVFEHCLTVSTHSARTAFILFSVLFAWVSLSIYGTSSRRKPAMLTVACHKRSLGTFILMKKKEQKKRKQIEIRSNATKTTWTGNRANVESKERWNIVGGFLPPLKGDFRLCKTIESSTHTIFFLGIESKCINRKM